MIADGTSEAFSMGLVTPELLRAISRPKNQNLKGFDTSWFRNEFWDGYVRLLGVYSGVCASSRKQMFSERQFAQHAYCQPAEITYPIGIANR